MSNPVWSLRDVTLPGPDRNRLDGISVDIPTGVTAVLGISGAGKSSLLNVLAGFEKATSGSIDFDEESSARIPLYWSPQDYGLWPHLTVAQQVDHVLPASGDAGRSVDDWLSDFRLQSVAESRPGQLSLGERSRLSVVRALASDAQTLILDEPLAHVDPVHVDGYWNVLSRHAAERARAVVFSAHQPSRVLATAAHVVCLNEGRLAWSGPTVELYTSPPTPELAWLLGPCNCFESSEEAQQWGFTSTDAVPDSIDIEEHGYPGGWIERVRPVCLRPEETRFTGSDSSPTIVDSVVTSGTMLTIYVHLEESEERRAFHARLDSDVAAGERASFELVPCPARQSIESNR